jgi:hypothetical protein
MKVNMKMKTMIKSKRRAMIKGDMRMMGIRKEVTQEQNHHIQRCATPCKNIILGDIEKGVTTRLCVANFCQYYSFVYSFKPFKVEDGLRDLDWVVAMQEELNNFNHNEVWYLVERPKQNVVGTKWVFCNK